MVTYFIVGRVLFDRYSAILSASLQISIVLNEVPPNMLRSMIKLNPSSWIWTNVTSLNRFLTIR